MVPKRKSAISDAGPMGFVGKSPLVSGSSSFKCVMLDFDGTLTDVNKEAATFEDRYRHDLAKAFGAYESELLDIWLEVKSRVLADRNSYGWKINGKIVAPCHADPHVLSMVIATEVLDQEKLMKDPQERLRFTDNLFNKNYSRNPTIFREHAKEFVNELMADSFLGIVSNTGTEVIGRKIALLGLDKIPRIFGGAQKYSIEDSWEDVQESIRIDGVERPIYLRRKKYWDILASILQGQGVGLGQGLVVGDIYELDLSLPQHMGLPVCLMLKDTTHPSEIRAVLGHPFGLLANNLEECLAYARGKYP